MHRWPSVRSLIGEPTQVDELAAHLLDPGRERPVAVITRAWGAESASLDVTGLRHAVGDVCDVVEIADGHLTFRLSDLLPDGTGVWDGAARVYPVDPRWQTDQRAAPPRVPGRRLVGDELQRRVESDALRIAFQGGAFESVPRADVVAGEVLAFPHDDRALVRLDSGGFATVPRELVAPDLPFDWVLRVGDRVRGRYEQEHGRLLPRLAPFDVTALPDGSVVLGLVVSVDADSAEVQLHPDFAVTIGRDAVSKNPLDTVDLLLSPGVVVAAHLEVADGTVTLRLHDVDDDERPLPAPPILDGGSPWLQPDRDLPPAAPEATVALAEEPPPVLDLEPVPAVEEVPDLEPETEAIPTESPAAPAPSAPKGPQQIALAMQARRAAPPPGAAAEAASPTGPAPSRALRDTQLRLAETQGRLRRERAERLEAEAKAARAERDADDLEQQVHELEQRLATSTRTAAKRASALLARAKEPTEATTDRSGWFLDANDWARFEVLLAWAERVGASEKAARPLPEFELDPRFGDSLRRLSPTELRKAMRAAVDVLVGRVAEVSSREPHQLREGLGGEDPVVVRPGDRAVCWRAYIENVTAQAKRIHWWSVPGGRVELIRIVDHDETRP